MDKRAEAIANSVYLTALNRLLLPIATPIVVAAIIWLGSTTLALDRSLAIQEREMVRLSLELADIKRGRENDQALAALRARVTVPLAVGARRRTAASIGQFGEEDLFSFTADSDGRYIIDTRGPTDVVMKLFGPNSPTLLTAEDDDSRYATNARSAASLTAGKYWVQVRHYNRESGVGDYTVKVRRG